MKVDPRRAKDYPARHCCTGGNLAGGGWAVRPDLYSGADRIAADKVRQNREFAQAGKGRTLVARFLRHMRQIVWQARDADPRHRLGARPHHQAQARMQVAQPVEPRRRSARSAQVLLLALGQAAINRPGDRHLRATGLRGSQRQCRQSPRQSHSRLVPNPHCRSPAVTPEGQDAGIVRVRPYPFR
jgi:hypothetical protein